ncbi:hypothetical protein DL95DRAFT_464103 [Leptodontidium sp. 2 PMI_412]|nr:hypothetical protein DL95DRAFT_464103 [Leptodontidium sp. 2 PMI_412]
MATGYDTPMESQFDQDEQLKEQDSHEPPRRNSLSGSIKEFAKALHRGSSTKSAPKLTSYFDSWSRGRQPVRQAEREAQMNEPPRSVYQEMPYGLDESASAPYPRQDYGVSSQPQYMGYIAIPPSPALTAQSSPYDQNLTPQSYMSGPTVQQPHQVQNGGYYHMGFNVQLNPNQPNNYGPYVSLTQASAISLGLGGIAYQPNSNILNYSDDSSIQADCFSHFEGHVGKQGNPSTSRPVPGDDGRYPCPSCAKSYSRTTLLRRHLLRHTDARQFTCPLCKKGYNRSDIRKRHFEKCAAGRGVAANQGDHLRRLPQNPSQQTNLPTTNGYTTQTPTSGMNGYQQVPNQ